MFDYWAGTRKSLNRSGKTLAGWTITYGGNQILGGISPTLNAINNTSMETILQFRDTLLGDDDGLCSDVKNLLLSCGLRFLSQFLSLLKQNPDKDKKFEVEHPNAYLYKLPFGIAPLNACESCGVTIDTIMTWSDDVYQKILYMNMHALPRNELTNLRQNDDMPLPDYWNTSQSIDFLRQQNADLLRVQHDLLSSNKVLQDKVDSMKNDMDNMKRKVNDTHTMVGLLCEKMGIGHTKRARLLNISETNTNVDVEVSLYL